MKRKIYILDEDKINATRIKLQYDVRYAIETYEIAIWIGHHRSIALAMKIMDARRNLQKFNDIFGIEG